MWNYRADTLFLKNLKFVSEVQFILIIKSIRNIESDLYRMYIIHYACVPVMATLNILKSIFLFTKTVAYIALSFLNKNAFYL